MKLGPSPFTVSVGAPYTPHSPSPSQHFLSSLKSPSEGSRQILGSPHSTDEEIDIQKIMQERLVGSPHPAPPPSSSPAAPLPLSTYCPDDQPAQFWGPEALPVVCIEG